MEEQGEGRGLMGLVGSGDPEKRESFEMYIKIYINKGKKQRRLSPMTGFRYEAFSGYKKEPQWGP